MAGFASTDERLGLRQAAWTAVGLAIAGTARPQLAPMVAVVLAGVWARAPDPRRRYRDRDRGRRRGDPDVLELALVRRAARRGGGPGQCERCDPLDEGLDRLAVRGYRRAAGVAKPRAPDLQPDRRRRAGRVRRCGARAWRSPLRWCAAGAVAQFLLYGSYSVWWAGHTYGPRYLLDVLPILFPLAAAAVARIHMGRVALAACTAALAWSIVLAATGAFFYPHERWNNDPVDVDRDHARLWEWSDPQFVRCWRRGLEPAELRAV